YEDGQLKLLKGSKAIFLSDQELNPKEGRFTHKNGGFVLFSEGSHFHDHQLAVTYTHSGTWDGPITQFAGGDLPEAMNRLKQQKLLRFLLFGDSIAAGSNASGQSK